MWQKQWTQQMIGGIADHWGKWGLGYDCTCARPTLLMTSTMMLNSLESIVTLMKGTVRWSSSLCLDRIGGCGTPLECWTTLEFHNFALNGVNTSLHAAFYKLKHTKPAPSLFQALANATHGLNFSKAWYVDSARRESDRLVRVPDARIQLQAFRPSLAKAGTGPYLMCACESVRKIGAQQSISSPMSTATTKIWTNKQSRVSL